MKARTVRGLDPDGRLDDNLARIIRTRVDELHSFMPTARDPERVTELHDLRIAAKRLRYVLEIATDALGEPAKRGAKEAKRVQDLVGEIHDCDVMLPRIAEHLADLRRQDADALLARMHPETQDVDPTLAARVRHRGAYRGLETLTVTLTARRDLLFARFLRLWDELARERAWERLLASIPAES